MEVLRWLTRPFQYMESVIEFLFVCAFRRTIIVQVDCP